MFSPAPLIVLIQEGVAVEIAEAVVGALQGELAATAVNAPMVPREVCTCCSLLIYQSLNLRKIIGGA